MSFGWRPRAERRGGGTPGGQHSNGRRRRGPETNRRLHTRCARLGQSEERWGTLAWAAGERGDDRGCESGRRKKRCASDGRRQAELRVSAAEDWKAVRKF